MIRKSIEEMLLHDMRCSEKIEMSASIKISDLDSLEDARCPSVNRE
jgi:hypothetical protein